MLLSDFCIDPSAPSASVPTTTQASTAQHQEHESALRSALQFFGARGWRQAPRLLALQKPLTGNNLQARDLWHTNLATLNAADAALVLALKVHIEEEDGTNKFPFLATMKPKREPYAWEHNTRVRPRQLGSTIGGGRRARKNRAAAKSRALHQHFPAQQQAAPAPEASGLFGGTWFQSLFAPAPQTHSFHSHMGPPLSAVVEPEEDDYELAPATAKPLFELSPVSSAHFGVPEVSNVMREHLRSKINKEGSTTSPTPTTSSTGINTAGTNAPAPLSRSQAQIFIFCVRQMVRALGDVSAASWSPSRGQDTLLLPAYLRLILALVRRQLVENPADFVTRALLEMSGAMRKRVGGVPWGGAEANPLPEWGPKRREFFDKLLTDFAEPFLLGPEGDFALTEKETGEVCSRPPSFELLRDAWSVLLEFTVTSLKRLAEGERADFVVPKSSVGQQFPTGTVAGAQVSHLNNQSAQQHNKTQWALAISHVDPADRKHLGGGDYTSTQHDPMNPGRPKKKIHWCARTKQLTVNMYTNSAGGGVSVQTFRATRPGGGLGAGAAWATSALTAGPKAPATAQEFETEKEFREKKIGLFLRDALSKFPELIPTILEVVQRTDTQQLLVRAFVEAVTASSSGTSVNIFASENNGAIGALLTVTVTLSHTDSQLGSSLIEMPGGEAWARELGSLVDTSSSSGAEDAGTAVLERLVSDFGRDKVSAVIEQICLRYPEAQKVLDRLIQKIIFALEPLLNQHQEIPHQIPMVISDIVQQAETLLKAWEEVPLLAKKAVILNDSLGEIGRTSSIETTETGIAYFQMVTSRVIARPFTWTVAFERGLLELETRLPLLFREREVHVRAEVLGSLTVGDQIERKGVADAVFFPDFAAPVAAEGESSYGAEREMALAIHFPELYGIQFLVPHTELCPSIGNDSDSVMISIPH